MSKNFLRLAVTALFLSTAGITTFAKDAPTSAEQLRSEFAAAIKAKDTNAIISLFNLQGVSDDMKQIPEMMAASLAQDEVASVKLSPLPADTELTNELNGVRYFPNVTVVGMIDVESKSPGNATHIPYGESAGKFYLPGTVKETVNLNAPKEKMLGVMFIGLFPKKSEVINGAYVYLKGGKELTAVVNFTNSMSYNFWGDGIKSCLFTNASSKGSIKLRITEDGKNIYDSGMIEQTNLISYEKK